MELTLDSILGHQLSLCRTFSAVIYSTIPPTKGVQSPMAFICFHFKPITYDGLNKCSLE